MKLQTTWRCMGNPPHTPPCDESGDQDRDAEAPPQGDRPQHHDPDHT